MKSISFILLSWNSGKYLTKCFDSIVACCEKNNLKFSVVVIDNGSSDNSLDLVLKYKKLFPESFSLIKFQNNRGTTFTRNVGLIHSDGEFVCIIDSDTEILDGDLNNVLDELNKNNDIGIIAPKLILEDGSIQNSVKKFPTFFQKIKKIPGIIFRRNVPISDFYSGFPFSTFTEVESAISACWFFRRDLVNLIGTFDENIFYSPEDLDYCLRVHKIGKKVVYYPEFSVLHHTQQISHKKPFSKTSLSHFWGLLYYFKKHGGWFSSPVN